MAQHVTPWAGRELWLEAVTDIRTAVITESGCTRQAAAPPRADAVWFEDPAFHCRYCWHADDRQAVFTLERTAKHIPSLLEEAEKLGITRAVGLYQQYKQK